MWQGIESHDQVVEQFRRALARGRLASTYLFVGPAGIGKRTFAVNLAKSLLCQVNPPESLNPCGHCESCVQIAAGSHPDVLFVKKPADKNVIPVDLMIGPPERRMQEGLCHDLWQKPRPGGRRIAIVDDVDFLNEESANCLLKTLEEPPPGAVVMLVGTSLERQLPTIRSRSQIIRFHRLDEATVTRLLLANGLVADPAEAARIASHSDGSLERAAELLDEGYWDFRRHWLETLSAASLDSVAASAALLAFADAAGKEASARRGRIRQVIDLSIDFFTSLARAWVGAPVSEQADIAEAVTRRTATWTGDEETAATCAERSLEAREQLDRYVHQATLVECWMNDLAHTQSLTASA